jgi:antitoxin MazE
MAEKPLRMKLKVSMWGNSLAVRLPAEVGRRIGVGDGDTLIAEVRANGGLVVAPQRRQVSSADAARLRRFLANQKETAPVVAEMRRNERY